MKFSLNRNSYLLFIVGLCLALLFFFSWHIISSFNFDNDFGRDLVDIFAISRGDIRLLGPKLSFGGLHTSPWYYYLFVPVVYMLAPLPEAVVLANVLFSIGVFMVIYGVFMRVSGGGYGRALMILAISAFAPVMVFSVRNPGNAFTYMPLLLLAFVCGYGYLKIKRKKKATNTNSERPGIQENIYVFAFAFFGGLAVGAHPVSLLALLPFGVLVLMRLLRNEFKHVASTLALALFLFISSLVPNMLFEVTHGFVQIKNTFVEKSYLNFVEDKNVLASRPKTSQNWINNAVFLDERAREWGIPLLALILLQMGIVTRDFIYKKWTIESSILIASLVSWASLVTLLRWQYAFHYLFPVLLLVISVFGIYIATRVKCIYGVVMCGVLFLFYAPKLAAFYEPASRPMGDFRNTVNHVLPFLANEQNTPLSVYLVRTNTDREPHGFEYRYFLQVAGYTVQNVFAYNTSEKLLIFDETKKADVYSLRSWEMEQFTQGNALTCKTLFSAQRADVWMCERGKLKDTTK